MCYTVNQLAQLSGLTPRTLRYYDAIGLLRPARDNASGYRRYTAAEVDRLQQILLYREMGVPLDVQFHSCVRLPALGNILETH